jgi:hypothetical protein
MKAAFARDNGVIMTLVLLRGVLQQAQDKLRDEAILV